LPKGTSITAEKRRNPMAIQLSETAFMENFWPILGSAIFTADPIKGLKKDEMRITASRMLRLTWVSEVVCILEGNR